MGLINRIAIYLPQFHPIPENDHWWGKGFTEWRNVTKSKPLFKNHYQPHLPADLGFYDLRLIDIMREQVLMAQQYALSGFCFYHYWFNGKRVLELPLNNWLKSDIEFPFMLCWANENWTRRWDGSDDEILLEQLYNEEDDVAHIRFLCETFFRDHRYISVNGKPFILIYRPSLFPDIKKTISVWRNEAQKLGYSDIYIGYMQSFGLKEDPKILGFDCAIDFQPDFYQPIQRHWGSLKDKIFHRMGIKESPFSKNFIYHYNDLVHQSSVKKLADNVYPCVTPGWDNTARRKTAARIFHGSTPELFGQWVMNKMRAIKKRNLPNDFLFINAWNEWAEGNHLEPCLKWGTQYLEQFKMAIHDTEE